MTEAGSGIDGTTGSGWGRRSVSECVQPIYRVGPRGLARRGGALVIVLVGRIVGIVLVDVLAGDVEIEGGAAGQGRVFAGRHRVGSDGMAQL